MKADCDAGEMTLLAMMLLGAILATIFSGCDVSPPTPAPEPTPVTDADNHWKAIIAHEAAQSTIDTPEPAPTPTPEPDDPDDDLGASIEATPLANPEPADPEPINAESRDCVGGACEVYPARFLRWRRRR